tara:strand:- start:1533 stop:2207 length:675 start_codon:yes stop_codon:yes gene_type:complete
MIKNIVNLGDASIYCDFGNEVNKKINSQVIKYFRTLQVKKIRGVTNITPSYNKLIVTFNLDQINFKELKKKILNLNIDYKEKPINKKIKIPICCDNEYGLDIARLENNLKMSKKEIITSFLSKTYYCYMTGFIAGMPFLGDINKSIRLNRLETPRVKVPQGSVGLTEQFCNIYTFESPGGWNIVGRTPSKIFDHNNLNTPNLISPGDEVKFYEINKIEYLKIYE